MVPTGKEERGVVMVVVVVLVVVDE